MPVVCYKSQHLFVSHVSFLADASRGKKESTLLISFASLATSATEKPYCSITFPTRMPGLRITFTKGSKEYFAILPFFLFFFN